MSSESTESVLRRVRQLLRFSLERQKPLWSFDVSTQQSVCCECRARVPGLMAIAKERLDWHAPPCPWRQAVEASVEPKQGRCGLCNAAKKVGGPCPACDKPGHIPDAAEKVVMGVDLGVPGDELQVHIVKVEEPAALDLAGIEERLNAAYPHSLNAAGTVLLAVDVPHLLKEVPRLGAVYLRHTAELEHDAVKLRRRLSNKSRAIDEQAATIAKLKDDKHILEARLIMVRGPDLPAAGDGI